MKYTYPMIFCLLMTSCTVPVKKPSSQFNPEVAQQTGSFNKTRNPSSSTDEANLKMSFDIMMNSSEPYKEFSSYLKRLKNIYLRAESTMYEFDKELDQALESGTSFSFDTSANYKKMLVMYELSNRLEDKITYHYVKLTDMIYDKMLPADKRKLAKDILNKFKRDLDSKDPMEKLAFDSLRYHIAQAIRETRGIGNKGVLPKETPTNSAFKSDDDKIATLRAYRERIRSAGKNQEKTNDELNEEITTTSDQIQLVDPKGREPQAEKKFFPSTGSNGNIMGLIFPKGTWALTYDDGPSPIHTPKILKNLEATNTKATFFWLAQNVIQYPNIVEQAGLSGHVQANHSWSHQQLPKLSDEGLQKEIVKSTEVESKAYGTPVKFFRCPYGAGNSVPKIRKMIADLNMIHVFWNVDTLDWQDKDPDSIVARAKKQMSSAGNKGVILFHDIHNQSVIASNKLVEWSKTLKGTENEIRWVTLPEIVSEMNGDAK